MDQEERLSQAKRWIWIALALQVVIILYYEFTSYVDLYPFNDLRTISMETSIQSSLANDVPKLGIILVTLLAMKYWITSWFRFFYASSIIYYIVFFGIQFFIWWPRYILGASPEQLEQYNEKFANTIKILPTFGNHVAVDLQHNILQTLTVAILIAMGIALRKLMQAAKAEKRSQSNPSSY